VTRLTFPRNPSVPRGSIFFRACASISLFACASMLLSGCAPRGAESPGIDLGAPGTTWAAKTTEQRFGYMAAKVHPVMKQVFAEYDARLSDFQCTNCHSSKMELIDYKMPNQGLYSLPKERPYDDAIDYDSAIAVFMMTKVTPTLQQLLNEGDGPPTKVSCFNCHPTSE
jgi:hypothetical protein